MTLSLLIVLLSFALILEAFFSGSEMALISADKIKLRMKADGGNSSAKVALELLSRPESVLTTTLIGTNLSVAFQASIFTLYIFNSWGPEFDAYTVLILTPISMFFGELIPKTLFQRYSETIAPRVAPLIRLAQFIFAPALWSLGKYTNWLTKVIQPAEDSVGTTRGTHREELRYLLTYGRKDLSLKTAERRMIRKIFDFSKAEVRNALIPLINVKMVEDTDTVADTIEIFKKTGYSRLPVYHERVDNVVGILNVFDAFAENDRKKPVSRLMQPALYAPESQDLNDLMITMQRKGVQMTTVVDEYGGAVGAITFEDILEEIVGEIQDEYDTDGLQYRTINEDDFLIQGRMEIDAINEQLKLDIPQGSYETIAGFLLQQFNRIPEEGDELFFRNLRFMIRKASRKSIDLIEISKIEND